MSTPGWGAPERRRARMSASEGGAPGFGVGEAEGWVERSTSSGSGSWVGGEVSVRVWC